MHLSAPAILIASRPHGETAVIVRLFTEQSGVVAAYVAGGRGRQLRPLIIPGNALEAEIRAKSDSQLPFARLELAQSRGPWLTEPLPAAAISWICALTAASLPERNAFPAIYSALTGLLDAICAAPSARGWVGGLASYELLLLRELGYGEGLKRPREGDLSHALEILDQLTRPIAAYLLADTRADVMPARTRLLERLREMLA